MREALAAADHDFLLSEPRARRPRAARGGGGAGKRQKRSAGEPRKKLAAVALTLIGVGALAAVLVNALALQKARHPAPLFARAVEKPAAAPPVPAPRPERRAEPREAEPLRLEAPDAGAVHAAPPRAAAFAPEAAPKAEAPKPEVRPHDPISDLIRNGGVARGEAPAPAVSKSVAAAQKALVKLGFVLKADGVMGAATRQAIEAFERDHGRKSNGDLTPAVMRALASASGVAVN